MLRGPSPGIPLTAGDQGIVRYLRKAQTVTQRRIHVAMLAALQRRVGRGRLRMGGSGAAQFDALLPNYNRKGRDLLIEAKSTMDSLDARLAVGQLLDYRRHLRRAHVTDLAVLFPGKPQRSIRDFLEEVDVAVLWFEGERYKKLAGQFAAVRETQGMLGRVSWGKTGVKRRG